MHETIAAYENGEIVSNNTIRQGRYNMDIKALIKVARGTAALTDEELAGLPSKNDVLGVYNRVNGMTQDQAYRESVRTSGRAFNAGSTIKGYNDGRPIGQRMADAGHYLASMPESEFRKIDPRMAAADFSKKYSDIIAKYSGETGKGKPNMVAKATPQMRSRPTAVVAKNNTYADRMNGRQIVWRNGRAYVVPASTGKGMGMAKVNRTNARRVPNV